LKTVLVVDDAAFMRISIRKMLEKNGYEVIGEAENGAVAVEKYFELKPYIVTMDITMPEMNGLEALKAIVAKDKNANILMVSAFFQAVVFFKDDVGKVFRFKPLLLVPSKNRS
jgi:two-component system chemotaxis response regulator CheY